MPLSLVSFVGDVVEQVLDQGDGLLQVGLGVPRIGG
jgi:hypothetical protein